MKGNTKCKNSRFEPPFVDLGVTHTVHLWFDGKSTIHLWTVNDVATTLPLKVVTQINFVADFFRQILNFTGKKTEKLSFVPPFGGLRGNVHGSSMARWKARSRLPISEVEAL